MATSTYTSTHDRINKLQSVKGKAKLKFYQSISNFYDEMNIRKQSGNFQFEEDPFSKNVQNTGKIYHEVLLLMKLSQTKPQVNIMNIKFYDSYYIVIKNRDNKEVVVDKYEIIYNNFNDFSTPIHYFGQKDFNVMLR